VSKQVSTSVNFTTRDSSGIAYGRKLCNDPSGALKVGPQKEVSVLAVSRGRSTKRPDVAVALTARRRRHSGMSTRKLFVVVP